MANSTTISNGSCFSNTGYRQVVTSPSGEIRPVVFAVRSGYRTQCGTHQAYQHGDYIFTCSWTRKEVEWRISGYKGRPEDIAQAWAVLPQELHTWLNGQGQGRQESFLPAGFGWDGKSTVSDVVKESRIGILFKGMEKSWVDRLLRAARISPKSGLAFDWAKALPMPTEMDNPSQQWDGSVVDIDSWVEWVLWDANGNQRLFNPIPTSGESGSNYAHSETEVYDGSPEPMPEWAVKAARIERGAYCKDHCTYGCKWTLYKR